MDTRLLILAAAGVLAVLVVGALVGILVGRSRRRKAETLAVDMSPRAVSSSTPPEPSGSAEASTAPAQSDSPTADLLSPMSLGEWRAPSEPAPAAELPELSLAERTRLFEAMIPEVLPRRAAAAPVIPMAVTPVPPAGPELIPESIPAPEPSSVPVPAWLPPDADPVQPQPATAPVPLAPPADKGALCRPRAQARPLPDPSIAPLAPSTLVWPDEPASPPSRPAEFVEMVAPVEMWFGDYRVGVKSGSRTHAQFLKYADVLLSDLKGKSERAR